MDTGSSQTEVGTLLREWRERRRVTQFDLALESGVSTRHLSFVETGRSQPGRDTLLRIAKHLDVPFREQNRLLLATGYAPAFPERSLDDPALAPVHEAFELILARHDPFPAVVVDRHWNLVAANSALEALAGGTDIDPALLESPINVLRLGFHPLGLAPLMVNPIAWRVHFRGRLERQVETTGDEDLQALIEEIDSYSDLGNERDPDAPAESNVLGPLRLRAPDGGELSFFGMFATFDTPFEVTSSELAIELLFPVDRPTGETLQLLARNRRGGE